MIEILDWFDAHDEFVVLGAIVFLLPCYWFCSAWGKRRSNR